MLQRLYVNNFRCLENFEFKPGDAASVLLIGKNGAGKSTVMQALKVVQAIGRGSNRVGHLLKGSDFTRDRTDVPMRLELECTLGGQAFKYNLALDLPDRFKELRVVEESLILDGEPIYSRELALVTLRRQNASQPEARFNIDWHLVALPVIQDPSTANALSTFREWLARMVLLAPMPRLMKGETVGETLEPLEDASNLADWLAGLLAHYPAAYAPLSQYLQQVMPDLSDFRFERAGKESKAMLVRFKAGNAQHELDFDALSDGEKCFFLCGVVLAANQCYGPLFAFWDEPDNYLSLSEVSHFVMALRRGFQQGGGQLWMTSHNEEAVRRFSNDNTWVLGRKSHLEPTLIRPLAELGVQSDVIQALICGELEP
ncbi:AAA family ATPase [Roseateles sp.]|jgi:ABC-type Mn2+/Zn2+ transport system ATPase subunit|uniref:AAA family ATPase n=1 Tax=Roseateles sp. TaxID=1971397 RepID=UPI0037C66B76